jgi:hypothetical protein
VTELLLRPMADAFLQVGVFVAAFAGVAALVRWRYGRTLTATLARHPRRGVLVGALLGASPGCGGAILTGAMYCRGSVSFGSVVAALTATMGDASWVVMAADPKLALWLHVVLLVTGLATGYAVDALGIGPRRGRTGTPERVAGPIAGPVVEPVAAPTTHWGAAPAEAVAAPGRALTSPTSRWHSTVVPALAPMAFWVFAAAGGVVTVPLTLQLTTPAALAESTGGVDLSLVVGVGGCLVALAVFASGGGRLADDTWDTVRATRLPSVLAHGARETAFVTTWVAVAFVAQACSPSGHRCRRASFLSQAWLACWSVPWWGWFPAAEPRSRSPGSTSAESSRYPRWSPTQVAQDGDALLPMLALDRTAAVYLTVITTVPRACRRRRHLLDRLRSVMHRPVPPAHVRVLLGRSAPARRRRAAQPPQAC